MKICFHIFLYTLDNANFGLNKHILYSGSFSKAIRAFLKSRVWLLGMLFDSHFKLLMSMKEYLYACLYIPILALNVN